MTTYHDEHPGRHIACCIGAVEIRRPGDEGRMDPSDELGPGWPLRGWGNGRIMEAAANLAISRSRQHEKELWARKAREALYDGRRDTIRRNARRDR